jgi:hypothetical protein
VSAVLTWLPLILFVVFMLIPALVMLAGTISETFGAGGRDW